MGAWTPDGKRIAFGSFREGIAAEPLLAIGGRQWRSGPAGTHQAASQAPTSWSPNGQLLAFEETNPTTRWDIWVLHLSDRKAEPFLHTQFNEGAPRFSPDGHWLAYVSDESGRFEIVCAALSGPGREDANLNRRRHGAGLEPQRARVVLPQRKQNDGRGHRHATEFRCEQAPSAL